MPWLSLTRERNVASPRRTIPLTRGQGRSILCSQVGDSSVGEVRRSAGLSREQPRVNPMLPQRWDEIKGKLDAVLELEPARRSAYLDQIAGSDPEMYQELESLLASHENAGTDFLNPPPPQTLPDQTAPNQRDAMIGRRLGTYEIVEQIGAGGMGEVYRAFRADDQYRKQVAIKLVRAGQDSEFVVRRFKNERQILASLDHSNIARLLDGGTTEQGVPYFVMELIEGQPIDEYCDHHKLPTAERLRLFSQVSSAVQYAHQHLIIHRDIKPSNILVTAEGVPKLLDFGIAKILDTDAIEGTFERTMTLFRILTPGYASPEQVKGEPITTASDVYSLGVVLYELLTGRCPYRLTGRTPNEVSQAVCEFEPGKPSTVVLREEPAESGHDPITPASISAVRDGSPEKLSKRLRGDLDNIVLMALRKEPQRRYVSVEQFAEDIRRHLENLPVVARQDTAGYRTSKFMSRHKTGVGAAAIVALTLLVGMAVTLRETRIARAERARAERRFNDVRALAKSFMFDFDDAIQNLPGATHARQMLVTAALQYLDSLAQESKGDRSLQSELATAYEKVGDIQGFLSAQNLGNTSGALDSYDKALKIRKALAQSEVSDPAARRALAIVYGKISEILSARSDFAGALENDGSAIKIYEALANSSPADPKASRDLATMYQRFAYHLTTKGDFSQAVDNYRKALPTLERLSAANPGDKQLRLDLAHAYRATSVALKYLGDLNNALDFSQKALSINQEIARATPGNVRSQLDLAFAYGDLGSILIDRGDMRGAIENWQNATNIWQAFAAADPSDARAKVGLSNAYARLGWLRVKAGATTDVGYLLKSLEIRQKLYASDPKNGGRREALANSYDALGEAEVFLASNHRFDHKDQMQHWRKALTWYKQASDAFLALRAEGVLRGADAHEPDNIALAIAKCNAALGH
jgi:serine/threonine protein kinase/tetratricopeptide (TPR) repeat protein